MEVEEWRTIPGYDGYKISNHGRLWSQKLKRCLDLPEDKDGYYRTALWSNCKSKKFFIHRLVATVFLSNPENHPCVNHKDGNKQNNYVSNLEWCSVAFNNQHAFNVLGKSVKGIHCKPITLVKGEEEIVFPKTRDAINFLRCSWSKWNQLKDDRTTINGFRIKKEFVTTD